MIEEALKRGDLDSKYKVFLANSLLDKGELAEKQRKYLMDELIAKRQRDKEIMILHNEQKIQELNEDRWKLIQHEEDVLKKRQVFNRNREKGIEYLADLEMGKVSSSQIIEENEIRVDNRRLDRSVQDVITHTRATIPELNSRIQQLKADKHRTHAQINWMNRPYRGEEDIRRYNPHLDISVYMTVKELIYDIFDESWVQIAQLEHDMQEVLNRKSLYSKKEDILYKKKSWIIDQQVQNL